MYFVYFVSSVTAASELELLPGIWLTKLCIRDRIIERYPSLMPVPYPQAIWLLLPSRLARLTTMRLVFAVFFLDEIVSAITGEICISLHPLEDLSLHLKPAVGPIYKLFSPRLITGLWARLVALL